MSRPSGAPPTPQEVIGTRYLFCVVTGVTWGSCSLCGTHRSSLLIDRISPPQSVHPNNKNNSDFSRGPLRPSPDVYVDLTAFRHNCPDTITDTLIYRELSVFFCFVFLLCEKVRSKAELQLAYVSQKPNITVKKTISKSTLYKNFLTFLQTGQKSEFLGASSGI